MLWSAYIPLQVHIAGFQVGPTFPSFLYFFFSPEMFEWPNICLLYLFLSLKTFRTSLLSLLFMIEIPTFALLFQNFEPYFIPTLSIEGTWKPEMDDVIIT